MAEKCFASHGNTLLIDCTSSKNSPILYQCSWVWWEKPLDVKLFGVREVHLASHENADKEGLKLGMCSNIYKIFIVIIRRKLK